MILASLGFIALIKARGEVLLQLTEAERSQCLDALADGLRDETLTVRVHAAEALIALHHPETALSTFASLRDTKTPNDRILVWRVLAAAEPEAATRREYVSKIRAALCDDHAPYRTHAMEALAKLNEPIADGLERKVVAAMANVDDSSAPFALWRLAQGGDDAAVKRLAKLLSSRDDITRFRAIYALGRLTEKAAVAKSALAAALGKEPPQSSMRPMLCVANRGDSLREIAADKKLPASDRYFAAMFLADDGHAADIPILKPLLEDSTRDVRIAAAYALLKIDAQQATIAPSHK